MLLRLHYGKITAIELGYSMLRREAFIQFVDGHDVLCPFLLELVEVCVSIIIIYTLLLIN